MSNAAAGDPFSTWRDWMSQSERQWNSFMNDAMSTDQFSQSMGKMMDVYLNMQRGMNEVMGRYFAAMNMPTRTDVLSLANRLSEIEDRLSGIEDMLDEVQRSGEHAGEAPAAAAPAPRPPRTKKPPES